MKTRANRVKKTVRFTVEVMVDFDPSIMPNDDWRKTFYSGVKNHDDLAEFLARIAVTCGENRLSKIDGFADKSIDQAHVRICECELEDVSETRP